MAWDVMSGVTKTAWDILSRVANLCGTFCPGWQKMAQDVLSRDVLSGSQEKDLSIYSAEPSYKILNNWETKRVLLVFHVSSVAVVYNLDISYASISQYIL